MALDLNVIAFCHTSYSKDISLVRQKKDKFPETKKTTSSHGDLEYRTENLSMSYYYLRYYLHWVEVS